MIYLIILLGVLWYLKLGAQSCGDHLEALGMETAMLVTFGFVVIAAVVNAVRWLM